MLVSQSVYGLIGCRPHSVLRQAQAVAMVLSSFSRQCLEGSFIRNSQVHRSSRATFHDVEVFVERAGDSPGLHATEHRPDPCDPPTVSPHLCVIDPEEPTPGTWAQVNWTRLLMQAPQPSEFHVVLLPGTYLLPQNPQPPQPLFGGIWWLGVWPAKPTLLRHRDPTLH